MTLEEYEAHLRPKLDHRSLAELPGFPVSDFATVQRRVADGRYTVGIDFTIANHLAGQIYGRGWAIMTALLAFTPVLVAVIAAIGAFVSGRFWLLMAIPASFVGFFLGNPYNPGRRFFSVLSFASFLLSLWAFSNHWAVEQTLRESGDLSLAWVALAFAAPYWIKRLLYRVNQERLRAWALRSEVLMVALYEEGKLGILDRQTGESYWGPARNVA